MALWAFVRSCFLWMPLPLYLLCGVVFIGFAFIFLLRIIKILLAFLPFIKLK